MGIDERARRKRSVNETISLLLILVFMYVSILGIIASIIDRYQEAYYIYAGIFAVSYAVFSRKFFKKT